MLKKYSIYHRKDSTFEIRKEFLGILVLEDDSKNDNHCRINQKRIVRIICCKLSWTHSLIIDETVVILND